MGADEKETPLFQKNSFSVKALFGRSCLGFSKEHLLTRELDQLYQLKLDKGFETSDSFFLIE
jgi:hypothetical protein